MSINVKCKVLYLLILLALKKILKNLKNNVAFATFFFVKLSYYDIDDRRIGERHESNKKRWFSS